MVKQPEVEIKPVRLVSNDATETDNLDYTSLEVPTNIRRNPKTANDSSRPPPARTWSTWIFLRSCVARRTRRRLHGFSQWEALTFLLDRNVISVDNKGIPKVSGITITLRRRDSAM